MLPAIPIAASLLAILNDDDDTVDFDELFQRAVAFDNPDIFWSRIHSECDRRDVIAKLSERLLPVFEGLYRNGEGAYAYRLMKILCDDGEWSNSVIVAHDLVDYVQSLTMASKSLDELQAAINQGIPWMFALRCVQNLNSAKANIPYVSVRKATTSWMGQASVFPFWPKISGKVKFFESPSQWDIQVPVFAVKTVDFQENIDPQGKVAQRFFSSPEVLANNPEVHRKINDFTRESEQPFLIEKAQFVPVSWDDHRALVCERSIHDAMITFIVNLEGAR